MNQELGNRPELRPDQHQDLSRNEPASEISPSAELPGFRFAVQDNQGQLLGTPFTPS